MKELEINYSGQKRKYKMIKCDVCNKEMKIRSDYIDKHLGICNPCRVTGNSFAKKHGDYKKRLYKIWVGLKQRRYNYNVEICEEWSDYENFKKWALKNHYNDELTIDRIDNQKGYSPKNCQWITLEENAGKDKICFTDEEKIELYHERRKLQLTQREFAKLKGVSRNTIYRAEKYYKKLKGITKYERINSNTERT